MPLGLLFLMLSKLFSINGFEPAVIHAGYQCKGVCGCTFEGKLDGIKVTTMEHGERTTGGYEAQPSTCT